MINKIPSEPTQKQIVGKLGEDIVSKYLADRGHTIVERNYLKKWGEIDIITNKGKRIHFVEVKSVSRDLGDIRVKNSNYDSYRAEDNLHPWKLQRLARTIQSYLLDKDIPEDVDWQFDVATVIIDTNKGLNKVDVIEDLVL